jgi:hypothetical protein
MNDQQGTPTQGPTSMASASTAPTSTASLGETEGVTKKRQKEPLGETKGVTKKRQKESMGETEGVTKKRQKESQRRDRRSPWESQKEPQRRDRGGHWERQKETLGETEGSTGRDRRRRSHWERQREPLARTLNRKYGRRHLLKTRHGDRTRRSGPSPGGMGWKGCHPAGPCTELWRRYGAPEFR